MKWNVIVQKVYYPLMVLMVKALDLYPNLLCATEDLISNQKPLLRSFTVLCKPVAEHFLTEKQYVSFLEFPGIHIIQLLDN